MARFRSYKNPVTHSRTRRRSRRHKGFMGELGAGTDIMRSGITASFDAVKAVGVVAVIAAGGAIATDWIFKQLADKNKPGYDILGLKVGSMSEQIAKGVAGIAGGLVIGKFLKKPQLGAAFAIGAVALAVYNIINTELMKPATTAGLGYIEAKRTGFRPGPLALGAQRVASATAFQPMPVPASTMAGFV